MTRLRPLISPALQLAGLIAASVGLGMIWLPVGVIAAGLSLFALGLVIDLPARRR